MAGTLAQRDGNLQSAGFARWRKSGGRFHRRDKARALEVYAVYRVNGDQDGRPRRYASAPRCFCSRKLPITPFLRELDDSVGDPARKATLCPGAEKGRHPVFEVGATDKPTQTCGDQSDLQAMGSTSR